MKRLSILGSTGSIGQSALNLVDQFPERFRVVALAAHSNVDLLCEQAIRYRPKLVAAHDEASYVQLSGRLNGIRVVGGAQGVIEAATYPDADSVIAGISGAAGLVPTYRAIQERKNIALANKETLVMAGDLVMAEARRKGVSLLPVDSEHVAIHQCLAGAQAKDVRRLVLTASGGPFFRYSEDQLEQVTVEDALNHPTWRMGRKITVDSATMMNKGLEVIEAHHLFGVTGDQISVVIHPQSTVHSMVEFVDGSFMAQLSITDMRSAILYALSYPARWESNLPRLDLSRMSLEFYPPDPLRFRCLSLAYHALASGKSCPAAMNAANEVAVDCFLKGRILFTDIPRIIESVLMRHQVVEIKDLDSVLAVDAEARVRALEISQKVVQRSVSEPTGQKSGGF